LATASTLAPEGRVGGYCVFLVLRNIGQQINQVSTSERAKCLELPSEDRDHKSQRLSNLVRADLKMLGERDKQ
jgi:hypothetical protein